jgi:hypothetical protein
MIYFGCVNESGHYLFRPDLRNPGRETQQELHTAGIFPKCDGGFCPGTEFDEKRLWRRPDDQPEGLQPEGLAKITHLNSYTILSFWDRSVDSRKNSCSVFIEFGTWTFEEMVKEAKRVFPTIWERYTFKVVEDE